MLPQTPSRPNLRAWTMPLTRLAATRLGTLSPLARGEGREESLQRAGGVDPGGLIAFRGERAENFLPVLLVAGFHRDVELGALGRHVEEQPAVLDLENVGAGVAEPGRDMAERPRAMVISRMY